MNSIILLYSNERSERVDGISSFSKEIICFINVDWLFLQ